MTTSSGGRTTFRISAVLFGLSAIWEFVTIQSEAVLFGAIVGGAAVAVYHILYVALFAWLAVGLWVGHRSGYYVLFVAGAIYSIDRLQVLFARDTLAMFLQQQAGGHGDLLQLVGLDYLLRVLSIMTVVFVACWWGFVAYAYFRREYFGITASSSSG